MDSAEIRVPASKVQLLQWIGQAHDELERAFALLRHDQTTESLLEGGWSVKDLMSHITAWEQLTLQRIAARHDAQKLAEIARRFGEGDEGINGLNNEFYLESKDKPIADVRRDFNASYDQFTQTVAALPEEDLLEPGRSLIWDGAPLYGLIAANSYDHYPEHAAQIQAIVDRDNQPTGAPLEEDPYRQAPEDKEQLLTILQEAHNKLMRTMKDLSPEQVTAPALEGGRSVKDVLAHITAWERILLDVLNRLNSGKESRQDQLGEDFEGTDAFNEKAYTENKDRPLEEVSADFERTYQSVLNAIQAAPQDKLLGPDSPTWWGGEATWEVIADNTYRHYTEHAAQIERTLES